MNEAAAALRKQVIDRTVAGPGRAAAADRRAAFDNDGVDPRARTLIDKVARHAWKVTDEDVEAVTAAGLSDDEIFELAVCAALGQSARQLAAALTVLDDAADGVRPVSRDRSGE